MLRTASTRLLPLLSRRLRHSSSASSSATPPAASSGPAVAVAVDGQRFAAVELRRGESFNTFNAAVIAELDAAWLRLHALHAEQPLRGVFVRTQGESVFCAGADLRWMKSSVDNSMEENVADALALSRMLNNFNTLPCASIALVQGPAFGGGVGLVSCCDIAIGTKKAAFTLSEVKLGLIPATISPFVVARIGAAQSRRYMLTAETMDAERAKSLGLLHEVVDDMKGLDEWEGKLRSQLGKLAPGAVANTKALIRAVDRPIDDAVLQDTAQRLAEQRASAEGQKGLSAFFAKQPAPWVV